MKKVSFCLLFIYFFLIIFYSKHIYFIILTEIYALTLFQEITNKLRYQDIYGSDSDSEDNLPLQELLTKNRQQFSNPNDDQQPLIGSLFRSALNIGDYVLIKVFGNKNKFCHYAAEIISVENNTGYNVKYFRKSSKGNFFIFPYVEDAGFVLNSDILSVLEQPQIKRGHYYFNIPYVKNLR